MRMNGTVLHYNSKSVKARSGSASAQLLTVNWDDALMKVGDAKFPMLPTGVFTPEPDGITAQQGDRLVIALGNQWWTPNVVTVVSNLNPVEGQLASYTVQQGNSSRILTNTANQEVQMLHEPGEPLRITGVNYSTGAIGTAAVEPDAGQGYVVSSNSVTTVEGELKTVGGELISGGELKTVCVREELDIQGAPLVYNDTWKRSITLAGDRTSFLPSYDAAMDEIPKIYERLLFNNSNGRTVSQGVEAVTHMVQSPIYLRNNNTGQTFQDAITNGVPVTASNIVTIPPNEQTPAAFRLFNATGSSGLTDTRQPMEDWGKDTYDEQGSYFNYVTLYLEGEKTYSIQASTQFGSYAPVVFGPTQVGDTWEVTVHIVAEVVYQLYVKGPINTHCADYQTIDTRYSYTTPVITTDTRRNVYTITVYTSPLN